jgi:hypothetical protein
LVGQGPTRAMRVATGERGGTVSEANPRGYNFQVTVTSGHEAEAKAAEMAKKPNRLGMFMVRLLGLKPKPIPEVHRPKR